jgi:methylated-DNA-[protein]-cysteine S-methyltransferase
MTNMELDLEGALRGFDPRMRPPMLPDTDVSYTVTDTPVGPLVLAATEAGVIACSYAGEEEVTARVAGAVSPRVLRSPRRLDPVRRELDEYFEGRRREFTVPVRPVLAAPFARTVLESLRQVPYGSTTTYGGVARAIDQPTASRAVGNALNANPLCILLPCHRVLRSDGSLGGYAGGAIAKQRLLTLEGMAQRA